MTNKSTCVVVTSDEPWGAVWHTQLHYAWQLSSYYKVIYINPPISWRLTNLFFINQPKFAISSNLLIVPYSNVLPSFLGAIAMFVNDWFTSFRIRKVFHQWTKIKVSLVWHFDRYRGYYLYRNDNTVKHIYHVVDPYFAEKNDHLFTLSSDLVVLTSPKLLNSYLKLNSNTIQIPQGVDLNFYQQVIDPNLLHNAAGFADSILLLGTLTNDIDFDFLKLVSEKYPGKLLIIGPDKINVEESRNKFARLLATSSVHWLGPLQPSEFLPYLNLCKVGIIVYKKDDLNSNNLRSPLKVINYLAAGKSVITNIDCEIPVLYNEAIYKAESREDYLAYLNAAMHEGLNFNDQLVGNYLNEVSYDHLLNEIHTSLGQNLPQKIAG